MTKSTKNYRKFIAAAATATIVAGAVTPMAFAASFTDVEDRYQDAVEFLVSKGIKGTSDTTFGTQLNVKRVDAAVFVASALGLDTESAPDAGFTDVPNRAKGAVNALKAANITSGKTTTTFASDQEITRGELAIWLQRAFNLKSGSKELVFTDVSDRYEAAVKALVSNEITSGTSATTFGTTNSAKRGDFALFIKRAVDATAKEDVASTVEDVKAINAKTIEVKFNKAIDADTLKAISLEAGDSATDAGTVSKKLSEDGKTLTLTAEKYFKGDYTVKVPFETVKDIDGEFVKPTNKKVTVDDKAAPVLTSAEVTVKDVEAKITSITLNFDEDVKSISNVKIDGKNHEAKIEGNRATVAVNLDASKSYDVTVVNATDVVNNVKDTQVVPLTINVDNVAPSITNVEPSGENTVKVTLDEALKNNTLNITGKIGSFTANVVKSAVVNAENDKEYTVTLNNEYLFKNGNSDTVTLTVAKDALADALGNANESEITKTVTVAKDTVAPAVTKVETISEDGDVTGFTVTYNEEVQTLTPAKIAVTNSKGEILAFANVATAKVSEKDAKKVEFTFVDGLEVGEYNFEFAKGLVKDKSLAANESAKYSTTINVTDAEQPAVTTFNVVSAAATKNVVTVDFGTKVKATGTGSALNPVSYQLNGTTLPTDTEIAFAKDANENLDQTKVVITLPEDFVKSNDNKAIFRVTGVQTLDNKASNPFIAEVAVKDNTAPVAESFVASDLTKLTVTYSEDIKLVDGATFSHLADEIKLADNNGATVAFSAAEVKDNTLILTVTDASKVSSLITLEAAKVDQHIFDLNDIAQKAGVTVTK